ncbi:MAG: DUF5134 domain-containing protein [Actinobacteria bacterium]|nr:DUF5134 domain-containing protein [Actinomycetota bacterium]
MSTPGWLLDVVAGVALVVAALSAGQLVTWVWRRPGAGDADIAGGQVVMGIAVAGVLVAGLRVLPDAAWAVVFAVLTGWFDWRLWRQSRAKGTAAAVGGPYLPHLLYSATMLYVFTALAAAPSTKAAGMAGMPGMAGGASGALPTLPAPTLAFVLALLLIAFTVRDLDQRPGRRVALSVAMAFLLIIMI